MTHMLVLVFIVFILGLGGFTVPGAYSSFVPPYSNTCWFEGTSTNMLVMSEKQLLLITIAYIK